MDRVIRRLPVAAFFVAALCAFGASAAAFPVSARPVPTATNTIEPIVARTLWSLPDSGVDALTPMDASLAPVPTAEPPAATATPQPPSATPLVAPLVLRVPVLMYHYISLVPPQQSTDRFAVDLRVPPDLFEKHLAYLRDEGYSTIGMPTLWEALNGRATLPKKPVILTFDDGYADAYTNAFPLLKKYGFIGTFFITCNLIGRPGYMTWDQVKELDHLGMDIESHAMDHKAMSGFSLAGLAYEMGQARATLAQQLGHEVRFFAYPSGDYNATALQGAAANGYFAAFLKGGGSSQSLDWRYTLRRTRVTGYASVDTFKAALRY